MKQYGLYLFDLDGTIYRGRQVLPHVPQIITEILRRGSMVRFLTNNSAARAIQVSAILTHMGVPSQPDWVYGSGPLSARYCLQRKYREVFLVGEEPFAKTLEESGVNLGQNRPDAVVAGICRTFSYEWLEKASTFVRNGAEFLATNLDATFPLEGGRLQPGAGAIVASIETASGCQPTVIGKPMPGIAEWAMEEAGVDRGETLVVGDRLDTDIACGQAAGCDTFLVLTGVETVIPAGLNGGMDLRSLL